jgi:putative ABC transport system ATP-binding protein
VNEFFLRDISLIKRSEKQNIQILSNITLEIIPHQTTSLIGPSGAGKSSLLRLLNRLDDPTCGEILLDRLPLKSYNVLELRRKIGMVFQLPIMFQGSVRENIFYAHKFGNSQPARAWSAAQLLEMVGLDPELETRNAAQISVGQQQRVSLARTLATACEVLLLDEPAASLDPSAALEIMDLIKRLQHDMGLTIILVTHILHHAQQYSDYTAYLENGQLVEYNRTRLLFANPQFARTEIFVLQNERTALV